VNKTPAAQPPATSCRPALDDPKLDFIEDAARFAARHRADAAFRFLRFFTGCTDEELTHLMGRIYCESLPEVYGEFEGLGISCVKSALQPLKLLLSKKIFWRAQEPVLYDMELIGREHLARRFSRIYASLPRPKRITPSSSPCAFPDSPPTDPLPSAVTPRTLAWSLVAPLWTLPLALL